MNDKDSIGQRVKTVLDSHHIGEDARNALKRARIEALDGRKKPLPVFWKPLAFASLLLVLSAAIILGVIDEIEFPASDIEDFIVISSEDEFEFFEELEFYLWVEEEQKV